MMIPNLETIFLVYEDFSKALVRYITSQYPIFKHFRHELFRVGNADGPSL